VVVEEVNLIEKIPFWLVFPSILAYTQFNERNEVLKASIQ
jgi:hypothetical protein